MDYLTAILEISGKGVLDDSPGCSENLVNEINIVSPDVIASFLPSPSQEKFLFTQQGKAVDEPLVWNRK